MPKTDNSVTIDSGKITIRDRQRPLRVIFSLAIVIFGIQAIFMIIHYQGSEEIYHLALGVVFAFCMGLLVSREVFFRTYRNEIDVNEVSGVSIRKVFSGNGNVYLKLKLNRKTREIFLSEGRALQIKKELESRF